MQRIRFKIYEKFNLQFQPIANHANGSILFYHRIGAVRLLPDHLEFGG